MLLLMCVVACFEGVVVFCVGVVLWLLFVLLMSLCVGLFVVVVLV